MSYEAKQLEITTTPQKIVDEAQFDRVVTLWFTSSAGGAQPVVGFDDQINVSNPPGQTETVDVGFGVQTNPMTIYLPASKPLWTVKKNTHTGLTILHLFVGATP